MTRQNDTSLALYQNCDLKNELSQYLNNNIDSNGNYEQDTKDVANIRKLLNIASNTECQQDTYYNIAATTWENLQAELVDWINENGGVATINETNAFRVKKNKLKSC